MKCRKYQEQVGTTTNVDGVLPADAVFCFASEVYLFQPSNRH